MARSIPSGDEVDVVRQKIEDWETTISRALNKNNKQRQKWDPDDEQRSKCMFFSDCERKWVEAKIAEIDVYDRTEWLLVDYLEQGVLCHTAVTRYDERIAPLLRTNGFISIYIEEDCMWRDAKVTAFDPDQNRIRVQYGVETFDNNQHDFIIKNGWCSTFDIVKIIRTQFTRGYVRPRAALDVAPNVKRRDGRRSKPHSDEYTDTEYSPSNQQQTKPVIVNAYGSSGRSQHSMQSPIECKDPSIIRAQVQVPPMFADDEVTEMEQSTSSPLSAVMEMRVHPSQELYRGDITECPACGRSVEEEGCVFIRPKNHDPRMMDMINHICSLNRSPSHVNQ